MQLVHADCAWDKHHFRYQTFLDYELHMYWIWWVLDKIKLPTISENKDVNVLILAPLHTALTVQVFWSND